MPSDSEVLTVSEAAEFLHVSRSKLYDMCRRHEIAHGRFGKDIRFLRSALIAYLTTESVQEPDKPASRR